jgi:hypothetical protein
MKRGRHARTALGLLAWLPYFVSGPALAQTIIQDEPFTFGKIAISTNAQQQVLTMAMDGRVTRSPGIIPIEPGHPAQFSITGFPASSSLNLSIPPIQLSQSGQGGGNTMTVTFVHLPVIATDPNGTARIRVGGALRTSGSGIPYGDSVYFGLATLMISY